MFERSIKLVTLGFGLHASNTVFAELLYIYIKAWSRIYIVNEFYYFVLTEVVSYNVIMIILENIYTEIAKIWYKNFIIKKKKT